ncbi:hypothetical protein CRH09_16035 [Nocardia terpenica]|uniref:Uncharacterized protein n=1 Tax=Nocardia terpenica TaxID=455432 RepID=A0A291RIS3_9NOCA|nr:hypothetical protein CRH09_16035 [Nocardia terpenica]
MGDIHRTEVDGIEVTWRIDRTVRIGIVEVRNVSGDRIVAVFGSGRCLDLVQARGRFPKFEKVWDAVRHEFWQSVTRGDK